MEQELISLIEMLKGLAPDIWAIYVKQAYITGFIDIIGMVLCFGLAFFFNKWLKKLQASDEYTDDFNKVLIICGIIVALIVAILSGVEALKYLLNPEFWAIKTILGAFAK